MQNRFGIEISNHNHMEALLEVIAHFILKNINRKSHTRYYL